jgi:AcrR family transcriptional regulator
MTGGDVLNRVIGDLVADPAPPPHREPHPHPADDPGLRTRKKQQTRRHIADTATALFLARGYDAVTVDEVAQAASVSKKTVFNHFPAKEDLVFDRAAEREATLVAAVRDRPTGSTLTGTFRALVERQADLLAGEPTGFHRVGRAAMIRSSPALTRRALELNAHLATVLAGELVTASGGRLPGPVAMTVAEALLGAYRAVLRETRTRLESGDPPAVAAAMLREQAAQVFDLLENGFRTAPA